MTKPRLPRPQKVSDEHIQAKIAILKTYIVGSNTPERTAALLKMYDDLMPLLKIAPASAKVQYHNAYPGGYLDHVMNVVENSLKVKKLFEHFGGSPDCTDEEVVFAAMHHDLGKLGDDEGPVYFPEEDEYWNKKGSWYDFYDLRQKLSVYDRTIWLLQHYDVKFSKNEMIGIRMADGVFDPANKAYFEPRAPFAHKTNIGYIIHWADWMSTIAEKDVMRKLFEDINATND